MATLWTPMDHAGEFVPRRMGPGWRPEVLVGDIVRFPIIHKVHKQYKEQWKTELYKVQDVYHNGLYKVNNELNPRRDLQLVKGNVVKLPEKPKQEQAIINEMDQIGKAANNPVVKQLMNCFTT